MRSIKCKRCGVRFVGDTQTICKKCARASDFGFPDETSDAFKAGAAAERERLAKLAEDKAEAAKACGLFEIRANWNQCADFIRQQGEE